MSPITSHSLNLSDANTSDRCNCLIAVTSYKTKRDCLTKGLTERGGHFGKMAEERGKKDGEWHLHILIYKSLQY